MVIGLIIVLVGLSLLAEQLYDISIPWGPIIIILIGIFVISRWFRVRNRRR
jgi:predicted tellurium resistance membrane protein TerC